jgi:hypothetical protein
MKTKIFTFFMLLFTGAVCQAQWIPEFEQTRFPEIFVNPVVNFLDTGVTFTPEWNDAAWVQAASSWGSGTLFTELRNDWMALGCEGDSSQYPDATLFLLDDANDLDIRDLWDYASFEIVSSGELVTLWVFGNGDYPQNLDWEWIAASGIGREFIDDSQGYLVRYNNNPGSDKQFYSGTDPCPGDPDFDFPDSYGVFGHYNFNQTPFENGLFNSVAWNHELYELCWRKPSGGYILCREGQWIKACKPRKGQKGNPNQIQKELAAKICRDSVPYWVTTREGYIYSSMLDTTELGFLISNDTDSDTMYHITVTSSLSSWIDTEMLMLELAGNSDTLLKIKVRSNAIIGQTDTLICTADYKSAWAVIEGAADMSTINLIPDSLTLNVGDTVYLGGFGYDPDGRPLYLHHPGWSTTGNAGIIIGMPSHQHIPGFMAVGMFVAQNQGTGYIILENPNIAGDTIKDSTFVQVLTLSYEQKNRPGILLSQNFPNPFSRTTSIQFCLEKPIDITLTIHSIEGIRVRTLADGIFFIGTNSLTWDGKDKNGLQLPNGVYFYQLRTAEGQILTRKMILSD